MGNAGRECVSDPASMGCGRYEMQEEQEARSIALPFGAGAQAPLLILTLADGDGSVANVLALSKAHEGGR